MLYSHPSRSSTKKFKSPMKDVYGKAILDYQLQRDWEDLITMSSVAGKDILPLPYLFREYDEMPLLERMALDRSDGKVLDIGAGAGSHALHLQKKGLEVTAMDISPGAADTCRKRGVQNVLNLDLWDLKEGSFDTILLLMNGMGICGKLNRIPELLEHLEKLLSPGGQILADSSDIIYMFENELGEVMLSADHYYGEVTFDVIYKDEHSGEFPWLYVDFHNLRFLAESVGFACELLQEGEHYDYLARLSRK